MRGTERLELKLGPGNYRRIAGEVGVTRHHVSRFLRGKSGVSLEVAQRIADSNDITLEELWGYIRGRKDRRKGESERVRKIREKRQEKSLSEIGEEEGGISRQRVHELLGSESSRPASFSEAKRVAESLGVGLDDLRELRG